MNFGISGCGPAGLSAAIALTQHGHQVQLFERFDTPQPLGSGIILQPTGLAVMERLGCAEAILAKGHVIRTMTGRSMPSNKVVLNVDYDALGTGMHGLAVHRAALFEVLYARAQALGIPIRPDTRVLGVRARARHVTLLDQAGRSLGEFDGVIDASGANSPLHSHAVQSPRRRPLKYGAIWGSLDWPETPFDHHVLSQRYVDAHTMIGVLPIGQHSGVDRDQVAFFWSLPAAGYARWRRQGLAAWKSEVRNIWPDAEVLLEQIVSPEQMTLARYSHHTLKYPYGDRIAFIGDSAHATSPQLGQGANMGLLDAWTLGHAVGSGAFSSGSVNDAFQHYAELRRWHVRLFQLASLSLTPFYQSDSRVLARTRDLMFDPLSRLPVVRRLVAGLVTGLLGGPLQKIALHPPNHASTD